MTDAMAKRASKSQILVVMAIALAALFMAVSHQPPSLANALLKASAVTLLTIYAAIEARSFDGWLLVAILAFGAAGDALLEWRLEIGAAAFIAGHVLAMALYFRNWRPRITFSQRLLAALVVPLSVFIAATLVPVKDMIPVAIYAFFVSGMAASAWTSRFSRYRTGIGAMLFLTSDLLIFARMGPLALSALPGLLIWPLYVAGQVMICVGVVRGSRDDITPAPAVPRT